VKDRLFYVLFNELRFLRVPTEFHISIDDLPFDKEIENPAQAYMLRMKETANKIPSFLPPNDRCDILTQNFEDEKVEICNQYCPCLLCMRTYNPLIHPASAAGMVSLFRGGINTLVGQEERPPLCVCVCVCVCLCVCLRGSTETSIVAHCLIFPQLSRFETFGRNMTGYRYIEKVKETLSTGLAASHRDPQYNFSCS
jgi:hypothetical protein